MAIKLIRHRLYACMSTLSYTTLKHDKHNVFIPFRCPYDVSQNENPAPRSVVM